MVRLLVRDAFPRGREARRILVGTLFSAIGRGLTLPFLFVYLTQVRGLSGTVVGLLVGWTGVISLALAPLGGTLVDRFGPRRIVLPLMAVAALGSGSLALVHDTLTAFLALTVVALAGAALWSGQVTLLASLTAEDERQKTFGLSFTLLNLGIGAGGLIAGVFVDVARPITFQLIYVGDAVSFLIPALILLSMPGVGLKVPADAPAPSLDKKQRGGYAVVLRDKAFVRLLVFGLTLTTCGYAQMEVGFTAFSAEVAEVSPRVIGFAFAANTVVIVTAQLFVLRWLDGRSRTRALAMVGVIFAAAWLLLAGGGIAGQADRTVLAIIGVVACATVFASGETLLSPVMPALTNALATDELRGRYNAMGSMIWGVSGIVGPIAAGPLIGAGRAPVWAVLVISGCLVASALALRLHNRLTPAQDGRAPVVVPQPRSMPEDSTPELVTRG